MLRGSIPAPVCPFEAAGGYTACKGRRTQSLPARLTSSSRQRGASAFVSQTNERRSAHGVCSLVDTSEALLYLLTGRLVRPTHRLGTPGRAP